MMAKFDPTINLGHVVQAIILLVAGAVAYGVHTTTVEALKNESSTLQRRQDAFEGRIGDISRVNERLMTLLEVYGKDIAELKYAKQSYRP